MRLYSEQLLAPLPLNKLEDHPLLAVRECLFDIFAAIFHIGRRSSIGNLRTRHVVVTGPIYYGGKNLVEGKWGTDLALFLEWAVIKQQVIGCKTSKNVVFLIT